MLASFLADCVLCVSVGVLIFLALLLVPHPALLEPVANLIAEPHFRLRNSRSMLALNWCYQQ